MAAQLGGRLCTAPRTRRAGESLPQAFGSLAVISWWLVTVLQPAVALHSHLRSFLFAPCGCWRWFLQTQESQAGHTEALG